MIKFLDVVALLPSSIYRIHMYFTGEELQVTEYNHWYKFNGNSGKEHLTTYPYVSAFISVSNTCIACQRCNPANKFLPQTRTHLPSWGRQLIRDRDQKSASWVFLGWNWNDLVPWKDTQQADTIHTANKHTRQQYLHVVHKLLSPNYQPTNSKTSFSTTYSIKKNEFERKLHVVFMQLKDWRWFGEN